jgi:hypothetical protein
VRLGRRDTLDENLGLIIEVQASVFPEKKRARIALRPSPESLLAAPRGTKGGRGN